jgi:hypothetical protein
MSYKGTVKNGVVVLEPDANLPEGISVRVEPDHVSQDADADLDPAFKIGDLSVDCGIPDLAVNIDHYLYGHPKVIDVE